MKVFFIDTGGGVGGSTISLYYLVRGLMEAGIDPAVSFPAPHDWSPRFEALGATVRHESPTLPRAASNANGARRPSRPWTELEAYRALHFYRTHWRGHGKARERWSRILREVSPDLVYTNNDLPLNFDIVDAADRIGLPVVCHLRGFQPIRGPHRRFARRFRAGVAISEVVRRHYLDAGFTREQIHLVYNGIDLADYPWREPRADAPDPRVLYLGRLTGWKGGTVLLDAFARLRDAGVNAALTVAGDGPARGEWEAEAARRGLAGSVRFAGFVSEVVPLLHGHDLLVHTSIEPEPFGRVLIEGMAAGTPVAASDLGATAEIIENGRSGWLVPAGDAGALARVMRSALEAGGERAAIARAARRRVEETFSVDRMVAGVLDVLDRVRPGRVRAS